MSEIEKYIDEVLNIKTLGDGIVIIDEKGIIVYFKIFNSLLGAMNEHEFVGKSLFEAYPNLSPEKSTMMKALKGVPSVGVITDEVWHDGRVISLMENTYPVKKNGKIIGSVNISKFNNYLWAEVKGGKSRKTFYLYNVNDIIGDSDSIHELIGGIRQVGMTNSNVLIYGETGTGKELVAQSVHTAGENGNKPFLAQNCAAIPSNLLESIFFGTSKGAFTGAEEKAGIFEKANGGTVFLDEINSMEYSLQAKLLRVLEEKKVSRLGSFEEIPINVRIIASINKDPAECIRERILRKDLLYRLAVVKLDIKPLRERTEDIEPLCRHFINHFNEEMDKHIEGVDEKTLDYLKNYSWPGNVRELRNVIEGMMNFSDTGMLSMNNAAGYFIRNEIQETNEFKLPSEPVFNISKPLPELVDEYEKGIISAAMTGTDTKAALAKKLGITGQALNYKLKKYGLK